MSDVMRNAMRGEAERVGRQVARTMMGTVDTVDPAKHTVRVKLQPQGVLTGPIPVETISIGGAWKVHWLPPVGAQVKVEFQEGSNEAGVVTGCIYDDAHPPPEGVPVGAAWIAHDGGQARVQLNPDASLDLLSPTIRIGALGATFRRLMNEVAMSVFNTHTHGGGPGPTPQMNVDAHLTTNLKAS